MNILTQDFNTPHQTAPFSKIKNEDFLPAFQQLITETEQEVDAIAQNPQDATFQNTVEVLAFAGEKLEIVSHIFFNLNSAETSDELQKIAQEISPILTEHASKIAQNLALFQRIKKVFEEQEQYSLNTEQKTLLNDSYKGFVRNGALLSDTEKEKLKELNKEISLKSLQFGQNALAATNAYFKLIQNKEDLAGIPEAILAQYAEEAKERNLEGWVITLQYPSYVPFMSYANNRSLREELALANGQKSFDGGEFDNQNLIIEIIQLKQKKAELLGYSHYADYVLEERMAKSPANVLEFLNDLLEKAKPYALQEIEELKALAKADGIDEIQSFDHAYYAEKLRKEKYDFNDEELKPYFPLAQVQNAVFGLAEKLYGLHFYEVDTIDKYHPDIQTYEVYETTTEGEKQFKAILYTDYFPRKGKRAGAWMTSFASQFIKNEINHRPHISIVCNFTKPNANTPSLLSFQEVTTLFHEFGHALHGMLANTTYPNLSGTSVKWDFVELPSQFLENFCYEPEFLQTFALDYQSGEVLPYEKIQKIEQSKSFMEGYQTLRQLSFGLLDMAYHTHPEQVQDIKTFEDQQFEKTTLYPSNPKTAMSPTFSHIFQGGYSAGYYSYKWAEVLDADAFAYFKETGIFNPETAAKFKALLSSGGTQDPMDLYKNFRGREPKVESLLERAFGKA
ncbi:MAG: M3 family metallopeptidase [Bacteroidetes bacterium]|nr:M3 family metallopeptidase [Bacteroidota bacterium]